MAVEIIDSSELSLWVGLSKTAYAAFLRTPAGSAGFPNTLSPHSCMTPTARRAWIPLNMDAEGALDRSNWGAEERGELRLHPKEDFILLRITFTAAGFGHYYLNGKLTTANWKQWRFHGDLSLPTTDRNGRPLAYVTDVAEAI